MRNNGCINRSILIETHRRASLHSRILLWKKFLWYKYNMAHAIQKYFFVLILFAFMAPVFSQEPPFKNLRDDFVQDPVTRLKLAGKWNEPSGHADFTNEFVCQVEGFDCYKMYAFTPEKDEDALYTVLKRKCDGKAVVFLTYNKRDFFMSIGIEFEDDDTIKAHYIADELNIKVTLTRMK